MHRRRKPSNLNLIADPRGGGAHALTRRLTLLPTVRISAMASAAVLVLAKEVAGLGDVPMGPERAAACNRPRRQCWDALASIQRSLRPFMSAPFGSLTDGWQKDHATEVRDCCEDLRGILGKLQDHDRGSGDSQWASTEYGVLLEEIDLLSSQAGRLLGLKEVPAEITTGPESVSVMDPLSKGFADASAETAGTLSQYSDGDNSCASPFGGSALDLGAVEAATDSSDAGDTAAAQKPTQLAARRPVRLSVEDLHDEYPHCKWAVDGHCENGCTVGGCALMVEAW